ncbi:MAG TPA: hypothetical protein VIG94_01055 [Faecalibacter sp.]
MENQKFLDILFENRNKAYGAYELRTSENNRLLKALFTGFGVVALGMGGFVYSTKTDTIDYKKSDKKIIFQFTEVQPLHEEDIEDVVEPPVKQPEQEKRLQLDTKQVKEVMPTPTHAPKVQETILDREEIKDADLGAENREGTVTSTSQIGGGDVSDGKSNVTGTQNDRHIAEGNSTKPTTVPEKAITSRDAKFMAIFPGCEKEAKKGNDALTKCMSDRLSNELSYNLDDFATIAERENVQTAAAKMQFIVNRHGEITQVKSANGSHETLGKEAKKALERINASMKRKGQKIKPAQRADGSEADLIFSIPVRFQQM